VDIFIAVNFILIGNERKKNEKTWKITGNSTV
jgi:hypothetical protein